MTHKCTDDRNEHCTPDHCTTIGCPNQGQEDDVASEVQLATIARSRCFKCGGSWKAVKKQSGPHTYRWLQCAACGTGYVGPTG